MRDLNGRNALVTGGSGGIGVYIARALARAGANVVVCGRREDALSEVAAELREMGVQADAVAADLYDLTQLDSLIERSEAALGPLDVLVNNAGVENAAEFAPAMSSRLWST
jgi:NAD(P)-dependent dehydrogenase (short-subunit alcohol dehydrogenase family)